MRAREMMFRERRKRERKAERQPEREREEIGMFPADETRPLHSLQSAAISSHPVSQITGWLTSKSFTIIQKYSFPFHGDKLASISMLPPSYRP